MGEIVSHDEGAVPRERALGHLERVVASPAFRNSPKLCSLLKYLVHESVNGRGSEIKEYIIGTEAYRRLNNHDSSRHSFVRTAVGRLREKLKTYYESEGADEELQIEIPLGGYTPVFRRRSRSTRALLESDSCVVLPFRHFGNGKTGSQLADDVTDELIQQLTHVRGLRIVSRTSSFAFRNTVLELVEIAQRLGVRRVIEGSVRYGTHNIELSARVIDASDGLHTWSGEFSGTPAEQVSVQQRMAQAITHALRPGYEHTVIGGHEPSLSAWRLYRQGRFHAERRTAEGWAKAIACFRRALDLDRAYALAYAGLADANIVLTNFGETEPGPSMADARAAAMRALSINPELAEAHTSLAAVKTLAKWDWEGAERGYQTALALCSSYAQAHHWYARLLSQQLRADEARTQIELALSLDPVSTATHAAAGMIAFEGRRLDDALRHFRDALELTENYPLALWQMGTVYVESGEYATGLEFLGRAEQIVPSSCRLQSFCGYAQAKAGNKAAALRYLSRVSEAAHNRYVSPLDIALIHVGLQDLVEAFALIEQAIHQRDNFLCWLVNSPYWSSLYSDPRFPAVARRVGLPIPL